MLDSYHARSCHEPRPKPPDDPAAPAGFIVNHGERGDGRPEYSPWEDRPVARNAGDGSAPTWCGLGRVAAWAGAIGRV